MYCLRLVSTLVQTNTHKRTILDGTCADEHRKKDKINLACHPLRAILPPVASRSTRTQKKDKMKTITKIIKRNGIADFIVEDSEGNWFRVQTAFKLEEMWQAEKNKASK